MEKITKMNQKEVSCIYGGVAIKPYIKTFAYEAAKGYLDCINKDDYTEFSFIFCGANALSSGTMGCLKKIFDNNVINALIDKINAVMAARRVLENVDNIAQ